MSRSRRFVTNVVWNWIGVAASLFTALILSPIMIRRLGPDGYGVWALSFALVDYYWFFDFGFRSATVKYVAHYTATGEYGKVGEVISTSLIYATLMGAAILAAILSSAGRIVSFFQVAPALRGDFEVLIVLMAVSWGLGLVLGLAGESLEAVQRFDVTSRVGIVSTAVRAAGQATLLFLGYGLVPLAATTVACQILAYTLNFIVFRRVFRHVPISFRRGNASTLRQLWSFGIHSFLITISTQFQMQAAPVLIGHFLPASYAGFYNLPMRLIQYTAEFVGRIGTVTNSTAAELSAQGDAEALRKLPVYTNRYCLALFAPLALVFYVYGLPFFEFWVGPAVAPYSAAVLPILLTGYLVGVVGQLSSAMTLLGTGRHQSYARGMVAEMLLGVALLALLIPRYGIVGAAWVTAALTILNRGLYLSYVASRDIGMGLARYLFSIYSGPLVSALPAALLLLIVKATVLPGRGFLQLAAAGAIATLAVYPVAFFICGEPRHRRLLYDAAARLFSRYRFF